MGKHKKKKPEIRFKGFTDDWEQRSLDYQEKQKRILDVVMLNL